MWGHVVTPVHVCRHTAVVDEGHDGTESNGIDERGGGEVVERTTKRSVPPALRLVCVGVDVNVPLCNVISIFLPFFMGGMCVGWVYIPCHGSLGGNVAADMGSAVVGAVRLVRLVVRWE